MREARELKLKGSLRITVEVGIRTLDLESDPTCPQRESLAFEGSSGPQDNWGPMKLAHTSHSPGLASISSCSSLCSVADLRLHCG